MTNKEIQKVECIEDILSIVNNQIDDIKTNYKNTKKMSNFSQGELRGLLMVKELLDQLDETYLQDTPDIMDMGLNELSISKD
jgi:hypothetical protein